MRSEPSAYGRRSTTGSDHCSRPLHISILNLREGGQVGRELEVEVLCFIPIERLQAWVFSTRTGWWYPQAPFWRNNAILISACRFGDDMARPGETFGFCITEMAQSLHGPLSMLPPDVPKTNVLAVIRQ